MDNIISTKAVPKRFLIEDVEVYEFELKHIPNRDRRDRDLDMNGQHRCIRVIRRQLQTCVQWKMHSNSPYSGKKYKQRFKTSKYYTAFEYHRCCYLNERITKVIFALNNIKLLPEIAIQIKQFAIDNLYD